MIVELFVCDANLRTVWRSKGTVTSTTSHPCPARSRPAGRPDVLRALAARDGWTRTDRGEDLCPAHAATGPNPPPLEASEAHRESIDLSRIRPLVPVMAPAAAAPGPRAETPQRAPRAFAAAPWMAGWSS